MQVTHISYSTMGGAGRVAQTLVEAQKALGWDAELITVTDSNLWEHPLRNPVITAAAVIDNYVISNRSKPTPISLMRSKQSALGHLLPELKKKKNLHLHWMEGVLTIEEIAELANAGVNIVWTLHDMAPFTGGCHHAFECFQFALNCSACPQAKPIFRGTVASRVREKINQKFALENIKFVAPSSWMLGKASKSRVLEKSKISLIGNPIHPAYFSPVTTRKRINREEISFVVVANDLSDPNKNIEKLLDEFHRINNQNLRLGLIGKNASRLSSMRDNFSVHEPTTTSEMIQILDQYDVLISASSAESFSLVIAEAQARGLGVMVQAGSAGAELASDSEFGYVFDLIEDLSKDIEIYLNTRISNLDKSIESAKQSQKFSVENATKVYANLYSE